MQVMKQLICAGLIAFSSAFFIGLFTIEKAEALCPKIGQYHDHGPHGTERNGTCKDAVTSSETREAQELVTWFRIVVYPIAGVGLAISVLVMVFAGYLFVTAGTDSRNVDRAKMLIISSGIGIFITLSTFILARMFAELAGFM